MDSFSDKHWQAFGLRIQDKESLAQTAEKMDVSVAEVRRLLQDMKQSEHGKDLFPVESDKQALSCAVTSKNRPKMFSYDKSMDDDNITEKW